MDSRVNLEHEVLLLFEVCDGVENIAHGQDGAAVRPPVLHVRRAFLRVVEQHAAWKQSKDQSTPRLHHTEGASVLPVTGSYDVCNNVKVFL